MALEAFSIAALLAIGMAAGAIAALIGGASLIAFPALIALGLSPIESAIALNVALTPAGFAGAYYDRSKLPPWDKSFLLLIAVAGVCAPIGALLLVSTPLSTFKLLVPLLLGLATVLFAFAKTVARLMERGVGGGERQGGGTNWTRAVWGIVPVSIYAGYFGAGVSALFLAVLSVGASGDYRVANSVKNLLAGLTVGFASAVYAISGAVIWPVALLLICGTVTGAWFGTTLAKIIPREAMRILIILIGIALTLVYAYRFWVVPLLEGAG